MRIKHIVAGALALSLVGCASYESRYTSSPLNACKMMMENRDWYRASYQTYMKWGVPISVQLSVIKHESTFNPEASPKTSTALGYAQALNGTFKEYKEKTGNMRALRTSYRDSVDFIGWYFSNTTRSLKHSPFDAETFYLAYHEGIGGYRRGTHLEKEWLGPRAKQVQSVANKYRAQLNKCNLPR